MKDLRVLHKEVIVTYNQYTVTKVRSFFQKEKIFYKFWEKLNNSEIFNFFVKSEKSEYKNFITNILKFEKNNKKCGKLKDLLQKINSEAQYSLTRRTFQGRQRTPI